MAEEKKTVKCEVCAKECKNLGVHMIKHRAKSLNVLTGKHSVPPEVGSGEETAKDPFSQLSSKMDKMVEGLNSVGGALLKLVEMQSQPKTTVVEHSATVVAEKSTLNAFTPRLEDETYPSSYMPPKFRTIIDTILSPEFKARIMDFADRTEFQFDIFVPEKFSSVSKEDREKGVEDVRTRIIPRALGENGVREWCEIVRRNLARYYQSKGVQSPFTAAL